MTDKHHIREVFRFLIGQIQQLGNLYRTFNDLFGAPESVALLNKSAPRFFAEVEAIYRDHFYLIAGRITDADKFKHDNNISVKRIYNGLKELNLNNKKVDIAFETICAFRSITQKYRHKMIAHADEYTMLSGGIYPEFRDGEIDEFFLALQSFVDEVGHILEEKETYNILPFGRMHHVAQLLLVLSTIDWESDDVKKRVLHQRWEDWLDSLGSRSDVTE